MNQSSPNLRKAAVLLRSLDSDTAAKLLAQLSPGEAAALRGASQGIGAIDAGEQADVLAALQRARPTTREASTCGVELAISSTSPSLHASPSTPSISTDTTESSKRFDFLENASADALASHLAREHTQTIAVVLSHLQPERAAAVLGALPKNVQTLTIERLATIGDTDPEIVETLESELAAWLAKRQVSGRGSRRGNLAAILSAIETNERGNWDQKKEKSTTSAAVVANATKAVPREEPRSHAMPVRRSVPRSPAHAPAAVPLPPFHFDDLIHLDGTMLSAVLQSVDPNALTLALAASREELLDRICAEMPRKSARQFRRRITELGPLRLSDVEAAKQAVAHTAAKQLAARRARCRA